MRVLAVTAVAAEADSVAAGLADARAGDAGVRVDVLVGGVGPAAAAAAAAAALTRAETADSAPYELVVAAGIGGGFAPRAPLGSLVVADEIVAADLGAEAPESAEGWLPVEELGFGRSVHRPPPALSARVAKALDAVHAPVLTVSTVTGTAVRAEQLRRRHPRAAAEAMEGFGVAEAAAVAGRRALGRPAPGGRAPDRPEPGGRAPGLPAPAPLPVLEIRAVSNAVGPRDRAAWRIGDALAALQRGFRLLVPALTEEANPTPHA
ncbi:futalosine hydrolase [Streptomyces sp. HNM0663]|uniref:Futalosine hydrolase n=1 Tax=Streptomyces chengmaiensis TaxID=3040919 RepID=A0ABT6HM09_9ACTN|nr:futalosine hydrolase [Streptomyces chengmaiensis]MDH2389645.1 futalosine hydrolase [Streptomyces chengmaiensis]